jgi:nicotinate-nucleotide pyrophosphorylase (carboxylating)
MLDKYRQQIISHIQLALKEDVGEADHSSLSCIEKGTKDKAKLVAKQDCIICGIEIARLVYQTVDETVKFTALKRDGDKVKKGEEIFKVEGEAISILTAERTALNYMQRLSAISTRTNYYQSLIEGTSAQLLDTRKTTPTMRVLEKYAVKVGGGTNHRFGLYDMIMLKDNHIDFAGGITQAIDKVTKYLKDNSLNIKIEIEVRNFEELDQVLQRGSVDRIMLDNFSVEDTKKAVSIINNRYEIESSGGITQTTISEYAKTGVNYISVGALTHKIDSIDLSLVADN